MVLTGRVMGQGVDHGMSFPLKYLSKKPLETRASYAPGRFRRFFTSLISGEFSVSWPVSRQSYGWRERSRWRISLADSPCPSINTILRKSSSKLLARTLGFVKIALHRTKARRPELRNV
jgi:hypothetical protein